MLAFWSVGDIKFLGFIILNEVKDLSKRDRSRYL